VVNKIKRGGGGRIRRESWSHLWAGVAEGEDDGLIVSVGHGFEHLWWSKVKSGEAVTLQIKHGPPHHSFRPPPAGQTLEAERTHR